MSYYVVTAEIVVDADSQQIAQDYVRVVLEREHSDDEAAIIEAPHVLPGRIDEQKTA